MSWTKKDLEKLAGKVKSVNIPKEPKNKVIIPKSEGKEKCHIDNILFSFLLDKEIEKYEKEFQFDEVRKFRFDWAIPSKKIAIEFEGLMSEKSRHTTLNGYSNDCIKYNLAQLKGWRVLRYTILNYKNIEVDLKNILKN